MFAIVRILKPKVAMYDRIFEDNRRPSLSLFRRFVEAHKSGGIAELVKGGEVTTSTVSRAIAELKKLVGGAELVRNDRRGFELTDEGKRLLQISEQFLNDLEDFSPTLGGDVTIAAGPWYTSHLIAPAMGRLEQIFKGRTLRLECRSSRSEIFEELEKGDRIDFAIATEFVSEIPGLVCERLQAEPPIPIVRKDSPVPEGDEERLKWLSNQGIVTIAEGFDDNFTRRLRATFDEVVKTMPKIVVECDTFSDVPAIVSASRSSLVGFVPGLETESCRDYFERKALKALPPIYDEGRALCVRWNKNRIKRRNMDQCASNLSAELKKMLGKN